jgi:hypothetical protein
VARPITFHRSSPEAPGADASDASPKKRRKLHVSVFIAHWTACLGQVFRDRGAVQGASAPIELKSPETAVLAVSIDTAPGHVLGKAEFESEDLTRAPLRVRRLVGGF